MFRKFCVVFHKYWVVFRENCVVFRELFVVFQEYVVVFADMGHRRYPVVSLQAKAQFTRRTFLAQLG